MITVEKIIKSVLKGKYSKLEANILITKHYKNEHFDSFYSEFKFKTLSILNEFMFELSDAEILRIIEDINEFNEGNDFNSKIDIPKVYVSSQYEWDKISCFYRKTDKYEFIFNVQGLDEKPIKTNYYKTLIFLNKLITNYITHDLYGFGFGFPSEELNKLQYYPVLLNLIKTLEIPQNETKQKSELTINQIVQAEIQGNLKTFQPQPVQETVPPKQKEFAFENNFDFVESNEVYNYFSEKLVSKRMLNKNELQEYLIQAFQELKHPKKLFKLKNITTKQKVNKVFYNYFKDVAQKPHRKRKAYAELLGEYFEGFKTENVMTNWSK